METKHTDCLFQSKGRGIKMAFNRKIKNKNIGYFLVNRRVFSSLRKAEQYCDKNNLDVDDCIRSENPDVLKEAKSICLDVLPLLRDMKESIREEYDKQVEVYHRRVDEFKESETKRDLLRGYKENQMHEALGVLHGIGVVQSIIDSQIENHEKVRYLQRG